MRIGGEVTVGITFGRRFDLDHSRAQAGEQQGGVRAGNESSAFNDRDAVQGLDGHEDLFLSRLELEGAVSV